MKIRPAAAVLAAVVVLVAGCGRTAPAPEPVRAVRTMTVSAETAAGVHEYAAEVRARTESRLGFRVAGKMTRRQAEVGRHVATGERLAELDPQDLHLGMAAANAAVRSA